MTHRGNEEHTHPIPSSAFYVLRLPTLSRTAVQSTLKITNLKGGWLCWTWNGSYQTLVMTNRILAFMQIF